MILCVSGYSDRFLHPALFPPVGTVTDTFDCSGLEEEMAVSQSLRIPHFCGTQKQVFQKAGCNARGPGGHRRSLDQLDVRLQRSVAII